MVEKGSKNDRLDNLEMALLQLLLEDLKALEKPRIGRQSDNHFDQQDCGKTFFYFFMAMHGLFLVFHFVKEKNKCYVLKFPSRILRMV